ncbi:putative serine incorporator [Trypoxylus dichotomus]
MLAPGFQDILQKVPFCRNSIYLPDTVQVDCTQAVGYLTVYGIYFIPTLFFALFAVLMIGVKSSKDPRAALENANGIEGIVFCIVGCHVLELCTNDYWYFLAVCIFYTS